MRKRRNLGLLALLVTIGGCGGDEAGGEEAIGISNVTPVGSVGGLVLDGATRAPLAGVGAAVIAGGQVIAAEAATGEDGVFAIASVPPGDVIVRLTAPEGYIAADLRVTVPNAAGDFPLANATATVGPIALLPQRAADAPFRVRIVSPTGADVPEVATTLRTSVRYVDLTSGDPVPTGEIALQAASNAEGVVEYAGLPDFAALSGGVDDTVIISVPPYDRAADGLLDYTGGSFFFSLLALGQFEPTIVLDDSVAAGALEVVGSTLGVLMGLEGGTRLISTGDTIRVLFNLPLTASLTSIDVFDESSVLTPTLPAVDGGLLTITFSAALVGGQEYNLGIHAVAQIGNRQLDATPAAAFFTFPSLEDLGQPILVRDSAVASRIRVTFAEPIGTGVSANLDVLQVGIELCGGEEDVVILGDEPGETGHAQGLTLFIDEDDPPGPVGRNGMSRTWWFIVPQNAGCADLVVGTGVTFNFTLAPMAVRRVTGEILGQLVGTLPF